MTALLDGIGKSIEAIRRKYDQEIREDLASVVIVILTDGGENASKFYTRNLIAETIKELDATGKWTFSFLGADLDAVSASDNLNIRKENIISFIQDFPTELGLDKYIDYELQFEKSFLEPLKSILDAIGWKTEQTTTLESFFS